MFCNKHVYLLNAFRLVNELFNKTLFQILSSKAQNEKTSNIGLTCSQAIGSYLKQGGGNNNVL